MTDTTAACIGNNPACPGQDGAEPAAGDVLLNDWEQSASILDMSGHQHLAGCVYELAREVSRLRDMCVSRKHEAEARLVCMEEALSRIARWAEAYPPAVFPEPDAAYYAKAREVLEANGMTLDRLSAAAMRHVITQVGKIAKEGLSIPISLEQASG